MLYGYREICSDAPMIQPSDYSDLANVGSTLVYAVLVCLIYLP